MIDNAQVDGDESDFPSRDQIRGLMLQQHERGHEIDTITTVTAVLGFAREHGVSPRDAATELLTY